MPCMPYVISFRFTPVRKSFLRLQLVSLPVLLLISQCFKVTPFSQTISMDHRNLCWTEFVILILRPHDTRLFFDCGSTLAYAVFFISELCINVFLICPSFFFTWRIVNVTFEPSTFKNPLVESFVEWCQCRRTLEISQLSFFYAIYRCPEIRWYIRIHLKIHERQINASFA